MTKFVFAVIVILTASIVFSGCGYGPQKPKGFPKSLSPCELTILQDGAPLETANVSLVSPEETKDWSAVGITDSAGVVQIYTYGKWKGAPKGTFKVVVTKDKVEGPDGSEKTFTLVDEQFIKPETTPLTLEIKGATKQTFDVGAAVKKRIDN
jgi:hypothetical protein